MTNVQHEVKIEPGGKFLIKVNCVPWQQFGVNQLSDQLNDVGRCDDTPAGEYRLCQQSVAFSGDSAVAFSSCGAAMFVFLPVC